MEKHKCKLCFRSFSNGRALGGHMKSHMMNLPLTKPEEESTRAIQLSFEAESASSSSIHLVNPEFSFAAADTGTVILQDRESETESSKNNPTRRRSKRAWKLGMFNYKYHHNNIKQFHNHEATMKKVKFCEPSKTESWVDHEPVSSVSDITAEEDVAFCLMMPSRDKWKRQKDLKQLAEDQYEEEEDESERSLEDSDESEEQIKLSKNRVRGRYKCDTCKKMFRSYQALGGHKASHKKIRVNVIVDEPGFEHGNNGTYAPMVVEKKIHECPVCFRVFASGQALGGHKRTHVPGSATISVPSLTKFRNNFIDLNLPAPIDDDDDDISQIENSAVSDGEFVKTQ
ncbi:zinc finger protein ZAT9-like isoform X2 [Gastrolobium bilobum]|uniref:zinc finger protein ZAT9-like isoform X2 n=1 Tax=Gastrolobium bilobum TaxID=150636 RepID=UPI002AB2D5EF|nr:zinc finger protein ZAT9-like isoform X2 [Gastrolobium bilobum]